jgi:hypothetical protein
MGQFTIGYVPSPTGGTFLLTGSDAEIL